MKIITSLKSARSLFIVGVLAGGVSGCVDDSGLNNGDTGYIPEERPIGVLASEDGEYAPGALVTITGRLTGTVTDQTLLWQQIEGETIEIEDPTAEEFSFIAPDVEAIQSYTFQISALSSTGEVLENEDGPIVDTVKVTVFDPAKLIVMEAEDSELATLSGTLTIASDDSHDHYLPGHSGSGHTSDFNPGDALTYNFDLEEGGYYTLYVDYAIPTSYGGKVGQVNVNGSKIDLNFSATGQFEQIRAGIVNLEAGSNVIEVGGGWNYYRIDSITLLPAAAPAAPLPVEPTLVNADASDEAIALMEFLTEHYGTATISGQTEFPSKVGDEFPLIEHEKITNATGDDAPAIVAFDYMNYSASTYAGDHTGLTESMIKAHEDKNVILSALFHWRAPSGNADPNNGAFYTKDTTFDLAAALAEPNSAEYAELLADIDTVSAELSKLQDAGIPVLWRPLHEAQGAWFWWGAKGADALKELWVLMYDRMTNTHGLNNLIWVFTHTKDLDQDWYPGDEYVDIVGYDGYAEPRNDDEATFSGQYATLKERHNGKKLVALTETGTIPNVSTMHTGNAWWSFFLTWNSETWDDSSLIGPDGQEPATIDENYAFDGVINLADVPGGREKVEAGLYEGFEIKAIKGWEAQANWSPTDGIKSSNEWAESGATALALTKDMTTLESHDNIVFQTYPAGGLDVSGADTLVIYANSIDAGATNMHVFAKWDGGEAWPAPVGVVEGGVAFELDVSEVDTLIGYGVRFQGLDATATAAKFFIDKVTLRDAEGAETIVNDFEPDSEGWVNQIGWANTPGTTVSNEWANTGGRALALYTDLVAVGKSDNVVFQTYPQGGIDVKDKTELTISVNAMNVGTSADAHIFFKAPDGVESWPAAVPVTDEGVELTIDVSEVDVLNGLGVRFNGVDASSTDAKFFIDTVAVDGDVIYDFEGTKNWEFQVNWSPADGIMLASDWVESGAASLAGMTQLVDGDDNIILQVYPEGGLLLGDVTTLKVTAHVKDAGDAVQVQLFAKDKDFNWRDGGAVAVVDGTAVLTLDISDLTEMSGFGVRFMGPNNSATESTYYLDSVTFE